MPDSPTSEPESDFVCDLEWAHSACAGEPFYKEHEGKRYCVLHFPNKEKSADFAAALQRKLENKDFNFSGAWFPDEVSFSSFDFSAKADFSQATFSAIANFGHAIFSASSNFSYATFSADVYLVGTTFSAAADFSYATFSALANFSFAKFRAEANFNSATFSAEAAFSSAKFRAEANFFSATFSARVGFHNATFGAETNFSNATFSGAADFYAATFSGPANFSSATFSAVAYFTDATFSAEAYFSSATFSAGVSFDSATFSAAVEFRYAKFSAEAYFRSATFSAGAFFRQTSFRDYVEFSGSKTKQVFSATSSLDLQFGKIEKPDRVSFHTLTLHPHWFINIDPRKFDFMNVDWENSGKAKPELELLIAKEASSDKTPKSAEESSRPTDPDKEKKDQIKRLLRLLAIACQRLATNCEDNSRYRSASHFRRMALDADRLETWHGLDVRRLNWWYWLASGYGERPFQALLVLIGILVLFGLLYTQVGFARWEPRLASEADVVAAKRDDAGAPLNFRRALTYSAGVLTFQKPEPRPATTAAQTVVLLETILGPVQAALLALAIRRKFMR